MEVFYSVNIGSAGDFTFYSPRVTSSPHSHITRLRHSLHNPDNSDGLVHCSKYIFPGHTEPVVILAPVIIVDIFIYLCTTLYLLPRSQESGTMFTYYIFLI